ncbi:DUF1800 domain-containing protein [Nioella aestuarii]|uniref:DUF1800 domain-containing protein n=1 Tax=Nioella aestuarii TaxID=1662864 RepID=UPI003D7FDC5F
MTLSAAQATIRFGTGLRPGTPAMHPEEMLTALSGPDRMISAFPFESFETRVAFRLEYTRLQRARDESEEALQAFRAVRDALNREIVNQMTLTIARGMADPDGLRERLVWFWADHFTTVGGRSFMRGGIAAYIDETIRPHVAGRFSDMLEAAILHPVMVLYLDQERSYGPNSVTGLRRGASLNENLARELLELHTVGADGGYTQTDVRQMAELLTGLGITRNGELAFRPNNAEPGAEIVLGQSYGGSDPAQLSDIRAVLRDLAMRPETARHISRKLADHFLSDTPDPGLVAAMQAVWMDTGGDLAAVTATLLTHPAALIPGPGRVKQPLHFLTSAMRALEVPPEVWVQTRVPRLRNLALRPMAAMGQGWQNASGPDGYFDDDAEWIGPQTLAARIGWCMTVPSELRPNLPDPRAFVRDALGDAAPAELLLAATRAESRVEGIGLILASPAFQRS